MGAARGDYVNLSTRGIKQRRHRPALLLPESLSFFHRVVSTLKFIIPEVRGYMKQPYYVARTVLSRLLFLENGIDHWTVILGLEG